MPNLAEIESVVDTLPLRDQRKLLKHLAGRLEAKPAKQSSLHDRLQKYQGAGPAGVKDLASNARHLSGYGLH